MKAKYKVSQLAAKPLDFEVTHPVHGETGIVVKLAGPHSKVFREGFAEFSKKDNAETVEADFLDFIAKTVLAWDEEAFEMPCTHENVVKFLGDPENEWISAQIIEKTKDTTAFFQ